LIFVELLFQETFAVAMHRRLIPIDTKALGNIAAIQLKPRDNSKGAETLQSETN
jgi:hypothetical protein